MFLFFLTVAISPFVFESLKLFMQIHFIIYLQFQIVLFDSLAHDGHHGHLVARGLVVVQEEIYLVSRMELVVVVPASGRPMGWEV